METRSRDDAAALTQRPPCGATTSNNAFRWTDSTVSTVKAACGLLRGIVLRFSTKRGLIHFPKRAVRLWHPIQWVPKKINNNNNNIKIHPTERWCELDSAGSEHGIVPKACGDHHRNKPVDYNDVKVFPQYITISFSHMTMPCHVISLPLYLPPGVTEALTRPTQIPTPPHRPT
jgi:hypothetical protein